MAEHVAHLAVLAFADGEGEPQIRALHAIERCFDRAVMDAVDRHARAQLVELWLHDRAMGPHAIATEPAGGWQFQHAGELAIIGQQQKTFSIEVEPPDADEAGKTLGQVLKNGRSAARIAVRGQEAAGLVIKEHARTFACRQRLAVNADAVVRADIERRRVDHRAIDGDAARGNPVLRLAARGEPGAGDHLGDPFAVLVAMLVGFGHSAVVSSWPGSPAFRHLFAPTCIRAQSPGTRPAGVR